MASSSKSVYGSSSGSDHRRKWDRTEWEAKAAERLNEERAKAAEASGRGGKRNTGPKVRREMLKPREYAVDLESKVGRSVVISKTTPTAETGGFYCDVCDCVVKDSINFLDHINGKNHQRNMGMSMKVKRSSLDDVRMRFATKKVEIEQKKKEYDLEERLEEVKEEEARLADARRQKRLEQRKRKRGDEGETETVPEVDDAFSAMMGFSGFASSKKKQ